MNSLIPSFIQDQYLKGNERGTIRACTMFIDLSGFTPLTEALMRQGNEGAEQLSDILNDIFSPMVSQVYSLEGFIPYFAGDAFTAIFPDTDAAKAKELLALACSLRKFFGSNHKRFGNFQIGIKIGLAIGAVDWGIVGDEHKAFYFRGEAIKESADAQMLASQQQIVLDKDFVDLLPGDFPLSAYGNGNHYLLECELSKTLPNTRADKKPDIRKEVARLFLPESLLDINARGEFRSVVSVFCSFEGVDTHEKLNAFTSIFLEQIHNFSGYFKEVDFGDKGGVLVGFFGAPVTFENNVERALEFVLALQQELEELRKITSLDFRIGMTSGLSFTGIVGGQERNQYAVVGNRVNLAARLMTNADWGEVLVDNEVVKDRLFNFIHKGNIRYKGIAGPVPTYVFKGRKASTRPAYFGKMVGREQELEHLIDMAKKAFAEERPHLAYVYGEAGIGKSRLAFELHERLNLMRPISWQACATDQILRKPFNPFIYFLRSYFRLLPENKTEENRKPFNQGFEQLLQRLEHSSDPKAASISRELQRTRSVIGALIGMKEEGSLWESLDAKGRYQNTLEAISNLFLAESLFRPMVVELEDGHWIDENSQEVLETLINRLRNRPVFFLITCRYLDEGQKPEVVSPKLLKELDIPTRVIDLNFLSPAALKAFAEERLRAPISQTFFELLQRTTNGNPFYLEQLLEYFTESNLLESIQGEWHIKDSNIRLSNSIHAILTARIDRLSSLVKETVKAAAVIGREFEIPILSEVMKSQDLFGGQSNLHKILSEQIQTAERSQIWRAMNELRYIFKHSLLREAVYDMQLRTRLRELHLLIAHAIENIYENQLEEHYADLAFHYEQAEVDEKKREYWAKAADYASQNYQNQRALKYYNKLLHVLDGEVSIERFRFLIPKGKVLELIGQWEKCAEVWETALTLAKELSDRILIGRSHNNYGKLLLLQGKYQQAKEHLVQAATYFEMASDQLGIAKAYGNLGNLYFRQGDYDQAKSYFIRSIEINRHLPYSSESSQIVASLGLTYMNRGEYDEGIRWMRSQLENCVEANDLQGMANIYTNMGIVYLEKGDNEPAQACFEKGLDLSEELGNKLLTSIALGSLGIIWQRKGDYPKALELYLQDLQLAEEMGDQQGKAIVLNLLGELHSEKGEFDQAIPYLEEGRTISEHLGYQKGLAKAINTLADVYYFRRQFEEALKWYDQAIDITRQIDNKLVLGSSLAEKGVVLVETDQLEAARETYREAMALAEELGNPSLLFEVKMLGVEILMKEDQAEQAEVILQELFQKDRSESEQADLFFALYRVKGREKDKKEAIKIYKNLYDATPKYLYLKNLNELKDR